MGRNMKKSKISIWLKWGIIVSIADALLTTILLMSSNFGSYNENIFTLIWGLINFPIDPFWTLFVRNFFPNLVIYSQTVPWYITLVISSIIWGFIVGLIIGLIISKIKSKKS